MAALPARFRRFFWDIDGPLVWPADQATIVPRLLAVGDLQAIRWVRARLGDDALRQWILDRDGRGLSARQLSYWGTVLRMPPKTTARLVSLALGPGTLG